MQVPEGMKPMMKHYFTEKAVKERRLQQLRKMAKKQEHAFAFISFTSTWLGFYNANFFPKRHSITASNKKETTGDPLIYSFRNLYHPSTLFFFGNHENHIITPKKNLVMPNPSPGWTAGTYAYSSKKKWRGNVRVPMEATWADHPDQEAVHDPDHWRCFKDLPKEVQQAWGAFCGIIGNAVKRQRIYFNNPTTKIAMWKDYESELGSIENYPELADILCKKFLLCSVNGNEVNWPVGDYGEPSFRDKWLDSLKEGGFRKKKREFRRSKRWLRRRENNLDSKTKLAYYQGDQYLRMESWVRKEKRDLLKAEIVRNERLKQSESQKK